MTEKEFNQFAADRLARFLIRERDPGAGITEKEKEWLLQHLINQEKKRT